MEGRRGVRGGSEDFTKQNLVAISDTLQHFNGAPHHHTKEEKSTPTQLFKQKPKTKPFGFFF
jgi:hypothetical protein